MTFGRWNARSMATFDRNRERRPQRARLVGRESYPAKKTHPAIKFAQKSCTDIPYT